MEVLKHRRRCLATALLALACAVAAPARAGDGVALSEQRIKAGLLYNFLKFVDWPADAAAPRSAAICVFGEDPFDGALEPLRARTVNQLPITLRRIDAPAEADGCRLLFVAAREKESWPALAAHLAGKSVLTVSDIDSFAGGGGMIELGHQDNRIRVAIDLEAVAAARLRVQDRLLQLAEVVAGGR